MPDNNALLYTMTTVAESLGSAMALLAAFALYRLQSISNEMVADSSNVADAIGLRRTPPDRERLTLLASASDWEQFLALMSELRRSLVQDSVDVAVRARMDRLPISYRHRRQIVTALCVALALTAVVMTGALTVLAAASHLPADSCLGAAPWAGVVGFVLCLVSYLVLIWFALGKGRS